MSEINIDMKDKRILRELFSNGRIHFSKIAKKTGLSKEVVHYRYNNLIKKGLLLGVNTIYDINKIGMQIYLVYARHRGLNAVKEREIIKFLTNHPNIAWIVKCIGNYDLILKFFVRDNTILSQILKDIEKKYPDFSEFIIDNVETETPIPISYLYHPLKADEIKKRDKLAMKIDSLDLNIMQLIANNSRKPLSELSTELNTSRDTIKYRLNNLQKNAVIITYRPSAWSGSKSLGYSWFIVLVKYRQLEKLTHSKLLNYLKTHINIAYIYELIGQHDLGFEIRLKTGDELNIVLMKIKEILGSDFKSNELSVILKEYKYTYFPNCLKENLTK